MFKFTDKISTHIILNRPLYDIQYDVRYSVDKIYHRIKLLDKKNFTEKINYVSENL